jgi:hypothetical protein
MASCAAGPTSVATQPCAAREWPQDDAARATVAAASGVRQAVLRQADNVNGLMRDAAVSGMPWQRAALSEDLSQAG